MEKMTKREMFEMIKGVCANDTRIVEFCEHEIELLNRKSSKSTQTKTQIENENIKGAIVNALTEIAKPVTITEMQELNTEMANYSNQKLSALLKQLVENDKKVVKTVDKKKSYFTVA
ncbi:MAG: hypothetical protein PUJ51_19415 [Clostridiales bacterium]|nr:hypothetical protein [Clostridiales bacterium]